LQVANLYFPALNDTYKQIKWKRLSYKMSKEKKKEKGIRVLFIIKDDLHPLINNQTKFVELNGFMNLEKKIKVYKIKSEFLKIQHQFRTTLYF
jgi:hypothetical protein